MAVTARSNRKVAPKASTKTEASVTPAPVSAPKTSIWTRVKTVAAKTIAVIVKPFKTIAKKIAPTAKRIAMKVASRLYKFWTLSLRPMLSAMLLAFSVTGFIVAAVLAPLTTALVAIGTALAVFGTAAGLKQLESREAAGSRAAHIALNVIDGIAQFVRTFMYAATAVAVFAMCLVSLPFALFVVIDMTLSYFEVRGATTIAFIVSCIASGNWAMALVWLLWRGMRGGVITERTVDVVAVEVPEYSEIRRAPVQAADVVRAPKKDVTPATAPDAPETWTRGNFLRAKGTEEMWGTADDVAPEGAAREACEVCGSTKSTVRIRTMDARFKGPVDGIHPVWAVPTHSPHAMLCGDCFAVECEDTAQAYTGMSLSARSVEVRLNKTGIEHSAEFSASTFAPEEFMWLETGWWRDKAGTQHAREFGCLLNGKLVATIVQDHRRKVFRASVLGRLVDSGVTKTLEAAKYAAQSDLNNELNAVDRHVEAAEAVVAESSRRQKKS